LVIEARRMAGFLFDIEDRVRRMAREAMGEIGRDADDVDDGIEPSGADDCVITFGTESRSRSRSSNRWERARRGSWMRAAVSVWKLVGARQLQSARFSGTWICGTKRRKTMSSRASARDLVEWEAHAGSLSRRRRPARN